MYEATPPRSGSAGSTATRARPVRPARRWGVSAVLAILCGTVLAGALGYLVWAHRPAIAAVAPPTGFARAVVERGAALALIGNCAECHTAPSGALYAGGRALPTPFGTVFASNITPDVQTGIGGWSRDAFARAMRDGVARDGSHLYPALPYDHFTHADPADLDALYAYFMTRPPVGSRIQANRLIPPLGYRPLLAGWKLLFLDRAPYHPDPAQSAAWNRGAYLVESLAHCGACHTPRNALGAVERDRAFAGGWAEGWYAPPLNSASPAFRPWSDDRLFAYLRTGLDASHAAAAGPMGGVAHALAGAPEADVRAIATYVAWQLRAVGAHSDGADRPAIDHVEAADSGEPTGAALFAGACATCHGAGAPMMLHGRPALALGTPLHEDTPRDTVQIILQGLQPPTGVAGPYMPGFGDMLADDQVAAVARYLRARFTDKPAWTDLSHAVATAREEGRP